MDIGQIYALLAQGRKIAAIRYVMDKTGVSIAEAKAYVEALPHQGDGEAPPPPQPQRAESRFTGLDDSPVRALLAQGKKIEAIHLVIQQTGVDLAQARDYMEALSRESQANASQAGAASAPPGGTQTGPKKQDRFFALMDTIKTWSPVKKGLLLVGLLLFCTLFFVVARYLDGFWGRPGPFKLK